MNFKDFLKPTIWKIILMIIFFAPIHLLQLAIGFQVTSVGFPYRFYHSLSTATFTYDFNLIFFIIDIIFWYLISCLIISLIKKRT